MIPVTLNLSLPYDGRNEAEEGYDLDYVAGGRNLVECIHGVNNGYFLDCNTS